MRHNSRLTQRDEQRYRFRVRRNWPAILNVQEERLGMEWKEALPYYKTITRGRDQRHAEGPHVRDHGHFGRRASKS